MRITREEIRSARTADLFDLLLQAHPDEFKREGTWLRMKSRPSLCMKKGCGGFKDYATMETGNSIDFLVGYLNYDFVNAVSILTSTTASSLPEISPVREVIFPQQSSDDSAVRTYLSGRGFPDALVKRLEEKGLLYQDVRRNAVFRNTAGDFYEARGTWPGKPFHQCGKKKPDCFWAFTPEGNPKRAYICESAIDAVSLYLLHMREGKENSGGNTYCGIAGVANQKTIERILGWLPAVLAVDNDPAGEQCRQRNSGIPALIPQKKDWNEDLLTCMIRKGE